MCRDWVNWGGILCGIYDLFSFDLQSRMDESELVYDRHIFGKRQINKPHCLRTLVKDLFWCSVKVRNLKLDQH